MAYRELSDAVSIGNDTKRNVDQGCVVPLLDADCIPLDVSRRDNKG